MALTDAEVAAAPVAERRHESDRGAWGAAERAPHPQLQAHMLGYQGYWEDSPGPQRRRHLPSGSVTLILGADPLRLLSGPGGGGTYHAFVAGMHETPAVSEHDGRQSGMEVSLTPLGARCLLAVPMHEVANAVVPLDDLLGRPAGELADRLGSAGGWADRFAAVDDVLLRLAAAGPTAVPQVAWAWRQLQGAHGDRVIGSLASELGWSRRHLAERFRHEVGLGPKAVARVLRFQRAVEMLDGWTPGGGGGPRPAGTGPRPSLADVAAR
ncbi:MAG TPA: DUF6597 domain-containing transcriptional factor, partial [Acidimicrobiales bacterium]